MRKEKKKEKEEEEEKVQQLLRQGKEQPVTQIFEKNSKGTETMTQLNVGLPVFFLAQLRSHLFIGL